MTTGICMIPISIGELWDKYTILQIKKSKISNPTKLNHVECELQNLSPLIDKYPIDQEIYQKLLDCNLNLWNIEDKIRIKEYQKEFDQEFISLARSVYYQNDNRASIKNEISQQHHSTIREVKEYISY